MEMKVVLQKGKLGQSMEVKLVQFANEEDEESILKFHCHEKEFVRMQFEDFFKNESYVHEKWRLKIYIF